MAKPNTAMLLISDKGGDSDGGALLFDFKNFKPGRPPHFSRIFFAIVFTCLSLHYDTQIVHNLWCTREATLQVTIAALLTLA